MVHSGMPYDYGGPKLNKMVKHEQPGTGFWPIIPLQFGIRHLWGKLQFGLTIILND